jgi:hypothetical protein
MPFEEGAKENEGVEWHLSMAAATYQTNSGQAMLRATRIS